MVSIASIGKSQTMAMGSNSWNGGGEVKKYNKALMAPVNEFDGIDMSFSNGKAIFSGIPATNRPAWVIVTNGEGEFMKQMRLTPEQNTIDLNRLHNGLYFFTITYRGKSKKAFTINL